MTVCKTCVFLFFFKQKTAYEMRISDWSSDVCSSDLPDLHNRNIRELFVDDKRNIILAVALTALILFGWPYVAEQFFPTPQPTQAPVSQNAPSSSSGTGPITETVKTLRPLHQAISEAPRIPIETPKLTGSINLKGARIDDTVDRKRT